MTAYADLMNGRTVAQAAKNSGLSRTWIYRMCRENKWPRNPPLTKARRAQVVAASRHLNLHSLAKAFSYAPLVIKRILKEADRESKRALRNRPR